jgi:hypothetical protein
MKTLTASGLSLNFDPVGGFIRDLVVTDEGREVAPLHVAPWLVSGETLDPDTPVHLARLAGDFFCAPFAAAEGGSPMHGWPANGNWIVEDASPFRAVLENPVSGARVVKELTIRDDHPFVYQRHVFEGGSGPMPVANHAMLSLPRGGILRFSSKRWFESSANPQETDPARGRSGLAYPARSTDPHAFPAMAGGTVDLTHYPWFQGTEDFAVGVEAPGHTLGWTAVTRPAEGDLYLSLRLAQRLPMTMLWHSNAGRHYAPWSGRHTGVLGVEEGAALHMLGLGSKESPDPLTAAGQDPFLTLSPNRTVDVRHVIGAIAWPSGEGVADVTIDGDHLTVRGEGGALRHLPFLGDFLGA